MGEICKQGPSMEGFAGMLRSLGFVLWMTGSHGMVANIRSAFWGDPCAAMWRTEPAAKAVVVIDDFSPWDLCSLENTPPTHSPHPLPLPTCHLKTKSPASLPFCTWHSACPGLCPISAGRLSASPVRGWGLIMHVLLCFIVQICVCDVVGTDK